MLRRDPSLVFLATWSRGKGNKYSSTKNFVYLKFGFPKKPSSFIWVISITMEKGCQFSNYEFL